MAHKLGGEFHIPHGRANAVILPYVIAYNAQKPTKFTAFPKYETFIADKKYAKIAAFIGCGGHTTEESVQNLIKAVYRLEQELDCPTSIKECGVDEKLFFDRLPAVSAHQRNRGDLYAGIFCAVSRFTICSLTFLYKHVIILLLKSDNSVLIIIYH